MIIYTLSILVPIFIIILEKVDTNISDTIDIVIAKIYLVFGNTRVAKKKLIQILDRNAENYTAHKLLAGIYVKEGGQRKAVDEYLQVIDINPKDFAHIEAIILSMTPYERKHPEVLKNSRKLRISKGSGRSVEEINRLLKQFEQMKVMMKQMSSGNFKMPF